MPRVYAIDGIAQRDPPWLRRAPAEALERVERNRKRIDISVRFLFRR